MKTVRFAPLVAGLLLTLSASVGRAQDPVPPEPGTGVGQIRVTVNIEISLPWQDQRFANETSARRFESQKKSQGAQTKRNGTRVSYRPSSQKRSFTGQNAISNARRYSDDTEERSPGVVITITVVVEVVPSGTGVYSNASANGRKGQRQVFTGRNALSDAQRYANSASRRP